MLQRGHCSHSLGPSSVTLTKETGNANVSWNVEQLRLSLSAGRLWTWTTTFENCSAVPTGADHGHAWIQEFHSRVYNPQKCVRVFTWRFFRAALCSAVKNRSYPNVLPCRMGKWTVDCSLHGIFYSTAMKKPQRSLVPAVHGVVKSRTWLSDFTFTFHFHALEKEMATHFSVLAWRIPGTREPGGLPSMGSHRVGHDWS